MRRHYHQSKINTKDEIINIRVSNGQKEQIKNEASLLDMPVSKYILESVLSHKKIVVLEGGKKLAMILAELNEKLNYCEPYQQIPVDEIRTAMYDCITNINRIMKGEG